jgi:hypothetical protein
VYVTVVNDITVVNNVVMIVITWYPLL